MDQAHAGTIKPVDHEALVEDLLPLIESRSYKEEAWNRLIERLDGVHQNHQLREYLEALQLLKQKEGYLKFSTSTFEILHQINLEVASLAPISEILQLGATKLKEISKAHLVLIGMFEQETGRLRIESAAGDEIEGLIGLSESSNSTFLSTFMNSPKPVLIEDLSQELEVDSLILKELQQVKLRGKPIISLICSPMIYHGEKIGAIFLARTVTYHSNPTLLQMLQHYCYQTALAISNSNLYSNELRIRALYKELFEEALNKGGKSRILQKVSKFINKPIILLDQFGNSLHMTDTNEGPDIGELFHEIENSRHDDGNSLEVRHQQRTYTVFPITFNHRVVAYMVIPEKLANYDQLNIVAIEQAKNVLSIQLNQEYTGIEVENRLRHDFLYDLISGLDDEEDLIRRGRYLNLSFEKPYCLLVLSPADSEEDHGALLLNVLERLRYLIDREMLPLSMVHGQRIILLALEEHTRAISKFLKNYGHQKYSSLSLKIGVSNPVHSPNGFTKAFHEAKKAAESAHSLTFQSSIVHFSDLGIIGLLFNSENPEHMNEFKEHYIGALIEYDQKNNSDLLETLEVFLDNESAIQQSAEKLHIHSNTLRYRLKRIEEKLNIDLSNPHMRMNLQIAIVIHRLIIGQ